MAESVRALPAGCFVSCDWGTTHLRLRLIRAATGSVLAEIRSEEGVARIAGRCAVHERARAFRSALEKELHELARAASAWSDAFPIVISGMASSSIGWRELPYAWLPLALNGSNLIRSDLEPISVNGQSHRVLLLSGARSEREIMRGEETQLLGLTWIDREFGRAGERVVVLPGTHSKHVHIVDGQVRAFKTFLTGELFQLLCLHSVLRHSVTGNQPDAVAGEAQTEADRSAFLAGVCSGASDPLLGLLFQVRTRQVLDGRVPSENYSYLSGLLIGAEIGTLLSQYPGRVPFVLCGGEQLTEQYRTAFRALGADHRLKVLESGQAQILTALGQAVLLESLYTLDHLRR